MKIPILLFLLCWLAGCTSLSKNEHLVMATNWYQTSAEMRALSYQAFNLARRNVQYDLSHNTNSKKRAVILDIDETILDNSPYQAEAILKDRGYPEGWSEWTQMGKARALPGAKEFLQFVQASGVEIFYVTNRKIGSEEEATYQNLKSVGFPVKKGHILSKEKDSSKESRRKKIAKNHRIILLVGDNLADFAGIFDAGTIDQRFAAADKMRKLFGRKFVMLPNPMYGTWEGAVYHYNWSYSEEEKNSLRKKALQGYQ